MSGNQTNTSCILPNNDWTYTFIPVYITIISVLGIVLNVFVLMVFCLCKKACTIAEIYLSNLAAADLLLVTCLPFWAVNVSNHFNWPFGRAMCKVVSMGITMNSFSSIYFLVLISMDRYLALVHPLSSEKIRRPRYAKLGCLMVWGLGFLQSVPTLIYRETHDYYSPDGNTTVCFLNYPDIKTCVLFQLMFLISSFFIPISLIPFWSIKIIKVLRNRLIEGLGSQNTDHKATILALTVLFSYLISWGLFHTIWIPEILRQMNILKQCSLLRSLYICQQIFAYLAFSNSVLNPVLYVFVGKNFREKAKELFKQCSLR